MDKKELIKHLKNSGINEKILEVIDKVDRKNFILKEYESQAYEDYPLPIGYGQTISQPYTVAFMIQELELEKGNRVLEIGTGSGWNAALIAELVYPGKVYTIEIVKELAEQAKKRLEKYKNVKVIQGDALKKGKKYAPYDKIILTAAPEKLDEKLLNQLKENGILLAPVGKGYQKMIKIRRKGNKLEKQNLGDFVFVPLIES